MAAGKDLTRHLRTSHGPQCPRDEVFCARTQPQKSARDKCESHQISRTPLRLCTKCTRQHPQRVQRLLRSSEKSLNVPSHKTVCVAVPRHSFQRARVMIGKNNIVVTVHQRKTFAECWSERIDHTKHAGSPDPYFLQPMTRALLVTHIFSC